MEWAARRRGGDSVVCHPDSHRGTEAPASLMLLAAGGWLTAESLPGNCLPGASLIQRLVHMGTREQDPLAWFRTAGGAPPVPELSVRSALLQLTCQPCSSEALSHGCHCGGPAHHARTPATLCAASVSIEGDSCEKMNTWPLLTDLLIFSFTKSYFGSTCVMYFPQGIKLKCTHIFS